MQGQLIHAMRRRRRWHARGAALAGTLLLPALAGSAPLAAPERVLVLESADLTWVAGKRAEVRKEVTERTPDGGRAVEVTISGPPSPGDRYSDAYSLIARPLPAPDAGATAKKLIRAELWVKPLVPVEQAVIFVVRRGYGESISLAPAGWRKVVARSWGNAPLAAGDVREIIIRTAELPDGARFLLGPIELYVDEGSDMADKWVSASAGAFTVNGLPWLKENEGAFRRLPRRAEAVGANVWGMSQHPSGARVRFKTDSTRLRLRVDHGNDSFPWPEFSSTAMAGIELYQGPPEQMTFRAISRPASAKEPYVVEFALGPTPESREFCLYLPMYARLASLSLALEPDARVDPPSPYRLAKPVVFCGTSFIQGGCASRASMNLPALIGRMLGVDIVNLGFAGDGRCEIEIADLMAEVDAACYVNSSIGFAMQGSTRPRTG